ncbi:MAG: aminoglycoside phosphotransferase family protein [Cyanobacteria bacterium HKST-UBA02]|nr:aminoglycoside phosphotransferase family protein [Cyanobacteria bacterium HKST-UBA02]
MHNQDDRYAHVDVHLARSLVYRQFRPWGHLDIEPVPFCGWDNQTFRLGEEMLIRLPSAERYASQVDKEQYWLPRLAPHLPLPVPEPLAVGKPDCGYPWQWSIYRWIPGEIAAFERIDSMGEFAGGLRDFLLALHKIDATDGPAAGPQNFYRGGDLSIYDEETRKAVKSLEGRIDSAAVLWIWELALASRWERPPVWVHGDISPGNLLVEGGKLSAVIDFGSCGVGDPACDLAIAWTFFRGESREMFKSIFGSDLDESIWNRGRGWTLWKVLITLAASEINDQIVMERAWMTLHELLQDQ